MSNFIFTETTIKDLYVVETKVFGDCRGSFIESYNENAFKEAGLDYTFVQDNQSSSIRGVLRGLHFQKTFPQAKLVRVISGEVFDVAVDLRKESPTYGKWFSEILTGKSHKQLLIPRGFAHGYLALSETAIFSYKCDDFYHPEDEGGIIYNDPDIGIDWPYVSGIILSEKDRNFKKMSENEWYF